MTAAARKRISGLPPASRARRLVFQALSLLDLTRAKVVQFWCCLKRVVKPLKVLEDIGSGLFTCPIDRTSAALSLQRREEAFHRRVVEAFIAPARAACGVLALEQLLDLIVCVLLRWSERCMSRTIFKAP